MTPFARRLAFVFVLALAVRGVHTAAIGAAPFSRLLVGDGLGYDRWAASIAAGDWIGKETFYQAPLYPYALAAVYATAGRDPMTIRWIQALCGALACVLLAVAGRRFLSPRAGWLAGVILALYPPAIFFDGLVQKASIDNLLMCALLAVLGAYLATGTTRWLAAAGVVCGLFALTRENALVFVVIVGAWLPFHLAGASARARVTAIGVLAAGVAIVLVPVGLRNKSVGGEFLITTSQAGPNFYIGNHEGATGRYVPIRSGRETFEFERTDATEVAEQAVGHALTPGAVSSYWWKQSIDWIGAHPVDWIVLLGKKVLVTWNRAELPDSESLEIYADYSPVLRALAFVFGFGILVAAAAPGLVLAWRLSPRPALLYLMLFGFSAAVAAFYVFARYRFPMVPILALFSGHTIAAASDALRARPRPKPDAAVAGAAALGLLVACLPPVVPPIGSRRLGYVNLAVGFASNGNQEGAAAAYRKAIALAPRIAEPHHDLAVALNTLGRNDEAAAELETAVRLDPQYAAAHEDLGALLAKRGDLEGAARHFRKAAELAPSQSKYHYRLAAALADLNRTDEAAAELESTLRLDPESAAAHDDLGVILARRGDLAGAERQFREAFRIDPARASTLANLGGVALEQGRAAEAADWYRKALAVDPGSSAVRANLAEALQRAGRR